MSESIHAVNQTMELADCRDRWTFDETYRCWCLEDVLYTPAAVVPQFQRLSIFVPEKLLRAGGAFPEEAKTVPVVFENNSAGYVQMPNVRLGEPRCYAQQYLDHGLIYVTCGCRGRNSVDELGRAAGKAPLTLIDLKTALRFLRHNREVLPGDWDRIVSVGWSAGGAMSTLLSVTGDNAQYEPYLRENGAFMDESDGVFAGQIYCPIIDLEHADLAYEWMFQADKTCEDTHAGPAETMSPFKEALSQALARRYVDYFNSLGLKDPASGAPLTLDEGGRSGSGYDYLMGCLNASATDFLSRLERGELPRKCPVRDYISGAAGPGPEPSKSDRFGQDKRGWLSWDGAQARISGLDTYVLQHRRRMKPCTSFDTLPMNSGENEVFGTDAERFVHFDPALAGALEELRERFPAEYALYHKAFAAVGSDPELARRVYLINPMNFIGTAETSRQAEHFRIRVGALDADTSLSISMALALKLQNAGCGTVDYAMVWDQPHCEADYPGEMCAWIDRICGGRG